MVSDIAADVDDVEARAAGASTMAAITAGLAAGVITVDDGKGVSESCVQTSASTSPMPGTPPIPTRQAAWEGAATGGNFTQIRTKALSVEAPDYGSPEKGTRTHARGVKAHAHVAEEMIKICLVIEEVQEQVRCGAATRLDGSSRSFPVARIAFPSRCILRAPAIFSRFLAPLCRPSRPMPCP